MLKMMNLIYINGRLASNEDLKSLLKDECRYGERALRTVHYTHERSSNQILDSLVNKGFQTFVLNQAFTIVFRFDDTHRKGVKLERKRRHYFIT